MAMKAEDAFIEALAASRAYTKETVLGGGAIKGKNCTISNKVAIEGGTRVYFSWTLDDGTEKSDYIDVMNGDTSSIWKVQGELGAKNLITYPYSTKSGYILNGITFTDNGDGSVTIEGTPTDYSQFYFVSNFALKKGSYILSTVDLLPSYTYVQITEVSTSTIISSIGNNTTKENMFTIDEDKIVNIKIYISTSAVGNSLDMIVYGMLRYASDTDNTYQPYTPTNKALKQELDNDVNAIWAIQGKFGSKNLLKTPYATPLPFINGGISFTESDDGGIIINGTSSGYIVFMIIRAANVLPHGEYILSTQETLPSGVLVQFGYVTQGETVAFVQTGYNNTTTSNMKVTLDGRFDGNLICIRIGVSGGVTVDNLEIHPMLRYAEDTDDTWQPYAMTNKQLTDALVNNGEVVNNESTASQELKSNFTYIFSNAVENLTISLPSNRKEWEEFNFIFTTSSTGCNLALPSAVTWIGGTPTLEADTYYEVSIKNNKAVIG